MFGRDVQLGERRGGGDARIYDGGSVDQESERDTTEREIRKWILMHATVVSLKLG